MYHLKQLTILMPVVSKMSKRLLSDYEGFRKVLSESKNIVALTGAGVSAESGIPVFRGAGGLWRTHRSVDLATLHAFHANPSLVWEFYHYRRNIAFSAQPNNVSIKLFYICILQSVLIGSHSFSQI